MPTITQDQATPCPPPPARAARGGDVPAATPIGPAQVAVSSSDPAHAPYVHTLHHDGTFSCVTVEEGRRVPCKGFAFRGDCRHHRAALPFLRPVPAAATGPDPGSWAARVAAQRSSGCLVRDCTERARPGRLHCARHAHREHTFRRVPPPDPDAPPSACDAHPDRYAHHVTGDDRALCKVCWWGHQQAEARSAWRGGAVRSTEHTCAPVWGGRVFRGGHDADE